MIQKLSEKLKHWERWHGWVDESLLLMCKIVRKDENGTSEHEEWFEGSRETIYTQRLFRLEDFLLFSLYSFPCIAKQQTHIMQLWLRSCLAFSICASSTRRCLEFTFLLAIFLLSDPSCYTHHVSRNHAKYSMCLYSLTGGKFCSKCCSNPG